MNRKISIDDFVISLAIFCNTCATILYDTTNASHNTNKEQRKNLLQFLFRLYDLQSMGKLEKLKIEKMLTLAYDYTSGNMINANMMAIVNTNFPNILLANIYKQQIDQIFQKSVLNIKDFEIYNGNIELLTGWVQTVINAITNPLSPNLCNLDLKYSVKLEKHELMKRYSISEGLYYHLKQTFVHCIYNNGYLNKFAIPMNMTLNINLKPPSGSMISKPEMSLETWINITKQLLPTPLACVIFYSKVNSLKMVWRFPEFAEFCCIFGLRPLQDKIDYLLTVFQTESIQVLKYNRDGSVNKRYIPKNDGMYMYKYYILYHCS